MKLATYRVDGGQRVGVVDGEEIYDLAASLHLLDAGKAALASTMLSFLAAGQEAHDLAQEALARAAASGDGSLRRPLSTVTLEAPLPAPGKLLCLAGNFADHILEGKGSFPGKEKMIPRFFLKPNTSIIGAGQAIRIPPSSGWTDWELELAVVIGKQGHSIPAAEAQSYIAGYTVFNDISARELSFRQDLPQREGDYFFDWLVGKWLDTFGPMGPWLTTADEVAHPDRLAMKLWVNDELHQNGNTGQMIFSPAEAIAFISQYVTLYPGDVIATGTPAGVGRAKQLQLHAGDRVRAEIEGLGVLENPVETF